jgi:hypothetical protein
MDVEIVVRPKTQKRQVEGAVSVVFARRIGVAGSTATLAANIAVPPTPILGRNPLRLQS